MYNNDQIEQGLKVALNQFCNFLYKNRLKTDSSQLKGELFTCMRRNLPQIVNIRSGFTISNIDNIHYELDSGKLLYLEFLTNYGGTINKELISLLNDIVEKLNIVNVNNSHERGLEEIVTKLQYYTH